MSDDQVHVPPVYQQPPTYAPVEHTQPPAEQAPKPEHHWSGGAVVSAAVAGAVIGGLIMAAGMLLLFGLPQVTGGQQQLPNVPGLNNVLPRIAPAFETTEPDQPVEAVAAALTPSVVNVSIDQKVQNPFTGQSSTQNVGNGSGVIVRSDGYILTNNHVVEGADRITVKIGVEDLVAKVVGTDAATDLAVIKIDKTGLPAAPTGDSNSLVVGAQVVAIGSPFGLDKTVTSGIVSALHRQGQAASDQNPFTGAQSTTVYSNLIQTDASINPGNSGGALADLSGKVIGINTLIQTGGAQQSAGVGFAIPINIAKQVAEQLIATGKASHAFLGVASSDLDAQSARQLGVKATSGALVQEVTKGSAADKAGIQKNDVIVKIDGTPVNSGADLVSEVRSHNPGDKITVTLERGGKTTTVDVTLGTA